jgi:hypothetical protein
MRRLTIAMTCVFGVVSHTWCSHPQLRNCFYLMPTRAGNSRSVRSCLGMLRATPFVR